MKKIACITLVIVALLPLHTDASTVLGKPANLLGLLAAWSFDTATVSGSSVTDTSGNGKTMTLTGTSATSGKTGQARSYNGSSDYGIANLGTQPTSISVSLWFKANSTAEQAIVDFQDSATPISSYHMTVLGIKNNALYASYWGISNITSAAISAGQWYHAVLTYDNTAHVQNLYLNGVLQSSTSGTWSGPGTLYFYLAQRQQSCSFNDACNDNAAFFNGTIDDVKVFSRALSPSDVRALYGGTSYLGRTTSGTAANAPLSNGLVGYWPLDGATTNWRTNKTTDVIAGTASSLVSMSTSTSPVAGKVGQALKFAGGYISASAAAPSTAYSVSAWIRYEGATPISAIKVAVSYGSGSGGSTLWMGYASDGKLAISNSSTDLKSSTVSSSTTWHHLVAAVGGGTMSAYMDGTLVNTVSMSSRGSNTLIVGDYTGLIGSFAFPGSIDDVRVYGRTLSAAEVAQLYKMGGVGANIAHSPSGAAAPISRGLIGYWTFDGSQTRWPTNTTQDSSGQGNTATMVSLGTTTAPVAGKIGQALHFNGNAQYVSASGSYPTGTNPRTLCAWAKSDDTTFEGNADHVVNYGTAATGQAFGFMIHTGNQWRFYGHGVDFDTNVSVDTKWHYHCVTYDGATVIYYIDGVNVASAARTLSTTAGNMTFAQRPDLGATNEFNGSIDDVRVYNRPLSASEVNQLYLLGAPSTPNPPPAGNPAA
ncbi:MAG TPA: LamG domain-containing protein [Candidatus Paceibacterota bacterium]|nr:LamG domain-containing protein [Candidatus Paceibacterota bacterium]